MNQKKEKEKASYETIKEAKKPLFKIEKATVAERAPTLEQCCIR